MITHLVLGSDFFLDWLPLLAISSRVGVLKMLLESLLLVGILLRDPAAFLGHLQ